MLVVASFRAIQYTWALRSPSWCHYRVLPVLPFGQGLYYSLWVLDGWTCLHVTMEGSSSFLNLKLLKKKVVIHYIQLIFSALATCITCALVKAETYKGKSVILLHCKCLMYFKLAITLLLITAWGETL